MLEWFQPQLPCWCQSYLAVDEDQFICKYHRPWWHQQCKGRPFISIDDCNNRKKPNWNEIIKSNEDSHIENACAPIRSSHYLNNYFIYLFKCHLFIPTFFSSFLDLIFFWAFKFIFIVSFILFNNVKCYCFNCLRFNAKQKEKIKH